MIQLTEAMFAKRWPHAPASRVAGILAGQASLSIGEINTPLRLAHFMAQVSHECQAGTVLEEDLNYSVARLMKVWPGRFPTVENAKHFAHNPAALANRVYNGRMGNRLLSDDGYTFRGRGYLQTTGRDKYLNVGMLIDLDLVNHPELAAADDTAFKVACGVWKFAQANAGADVDSNTRVTRAINGGQVGLMERLAWLEKWKVEFGV